jgi:hypothetical protein
MCSKPYLDPADGHALCSVCLGRRTSAVVQPAPSHHNATGHTSLTGGQYAYVGYAGLFAPRAGQQYRDDQRRRRSQYDRGTTAAENEARYEGLFDPSRVPHPGVDSRTFGAPRFARGPYPPRY